MNNSNIPTIGPQTIKAIEAVPPWGAWVEIRCKLPSRPKRTLKFLSGNGYAVLSIQRKLVTAVPEKLRKYKGFLEGKQNGKKS